jgi:hypothetical protein
MPKIQLHQFQGMTGVKGKLKGPLVSSVTGFMREIQKYRIVSGAGSYGAINVYRDDKGKLRGERHVRHFCEASAEFETKKQMRDWLTEQLPLCFNNIPTA